MIDRLDRRAALGAIAGALVGAPAALADQPLPAARDFEVRSPAGRFLARLAVAGKTEMWR
ncbi:MAG: hypothetical protein JNK46_17160, partial [Methylobacteriaceae bacterium]|nr:hypothetical protein [Methylobacteriaceae bacterium]